MENERLMTKEEQRRFFDFLGGLNELSNNTRIAIVDGCITFTDIEKGTYLVHNNCNRLEYIEKEVK